MRVNRFKLEIDTDGAAFEPFPVAEIVRILRDAADALGRDHYLTRDTCGMTLRDINGNTCGRARLIIGKG